MRWSGVVLLFLGALLIGLGGLMIYGFVLSVAAGTVSPGDGAGLGLAVFIALALLAGFTALLQGCWMVFPGRRNWGMLRALRAVAAIFIVVGMIGSWVMGGDTPTRMTF